MRFKPPEHEDLKDMAGIDIGRLTEDQARQKLENIRWPDGPKCVHCGSIKVTRLNGTSDKTRDGVLQCNDCRKQFTVTVGTVMEGSHITLRQWVQAFHLMCSSKKGVSALQLQRYLGLGSYRSAWHLAHRIRWAMHQEPLASKLAGIVEVDETYVGGKAFDGRRGRGASKKTAVVALIERDGRARVKPVERVNAATLKGAIREEVDKPARIMTDEFPSYKGIGREFKGGHRTVNHGNKQYVKGKQHEIHINSGESFFALLKRGVHGTFHSLSKQHLPKYCDEFAFRWSWRKVSDGERTTEAIKGSTGKRLMYRNMKRNVA